jgi:phosphotriesterase-related protein
MSELAGKVQTVTGTIDPDELGLTLMHEHLFADIRSLINVPSEATAQKLANLPFTLENLGWIRYNYFSHYENLILDDLNITVSELALYKQAGGGTVVDVSTIGIGRDPEALARASRASGVNVVMATGYYVEPTHPASVESATEGDLVDRMMLEISDGAILERPNTAGHDITRANQRTDVRAGVIKVGCSYPLQTNDKKVLAAAAEVQRKTGAPITIHVGRHDQSALEIAAFLEEVDANMAHTVLGHLDVRIENFETLDAVAQTDCFLEFDLFGHEISNFPNAPRDMPSDAQRLDLLEHVMELGHVDRVLVSHDICTKHRLAHFGGHGYGYIPMCVAPRMGERGWPASAVKSILVSNPARALAFAPETD